MEIELEEEVSCVANGSVCDLSTNLHLVLENQTANQNLDLNLGQLWTSITLHYITATPQRPVQFLNLVQRKTPKKGIELINILPTILYCLLKLELGGQGTFNYKNDYSRSKGGAGGGWQKKDKIWSIECFLVRVLIHKRMSLFLLQYTGNTIIQNQLFTKSISY